MRREKRVTVNLQNFYGQLSVGDFNLFGDSTDLC